MGDELNAPEPGTQPRLETQLPELASLSLTALGTLRPAALAPWLSDLYEQIDRPRANLGSSGPPGRAD